MLDKSDLEKIPDEGREEVLEDKSEVSSINTVDERKLVAKLDRRILPIICFAYLFECMWFHPSIKLKKHLMCVVLDRSNLGNARLQGLPQDTLHGDPTGKKFDWVTSVFYFSFVCSASKTSEFDSDL